MDIILALASILMFRIALKHYKNSDNPDKNICEKTVLGPLLTLFSLIVISFIVDFCMFSQIKKGFISRIIIGFNVILDICIFLVGIYEIVTVVILNENNGLNNDKCDIEKLRINVSASFLTLCTFARVYWIIIAILYLFCVFPMNFLPDWCCCKNWIQGDDIIKDVWRLLENNEWKFHATAMSHTAQKVSCLLCMQEFKDNQTLMLLPCNDSRDSTRMSKKDSTFGRENNSFLTS